MISLEDRKQFLVDDVIPVLKHVTVFSGCTEENLSQIFNKCSLLESREGEVILEEGKPATEIFILLKGSVSIILDYENDPFELAQFGPGNCIGEASVIGIQNHSATAVALEESLLLVLSRQFLMEIFNTDKALFSMLILNIAREIARRLHHTNEILLHYGKEGQFVK